MADARNKDKRTGAVPTPAAENTRQHETRIASGPWRGYPGDQREPGDIEATRPELADSPEDDARIKADVCPARSVGREPSRHPYRRARAA